MLEIYSITFSTNCSMAFCFFKAVAQDYQIVKVNSFRIHCQDALELILSKESSFISFSLFQPV